MCMGALGLTGNTSLPPQSVDVTPVGFLQAASCFDIPFAMLDPSHSSAPLAYSGVQCFAEAPVTGLPSPSRFLPLPPTPVT